MSQTYRSLSAHQSLTAHVPQLLAPVATFAIFAVVASQNDTSLNVTTMFTSLSLILLLCQPLFFTFQFVMDLASIIGCFERIEKFLEAETRLDHRVFLSQDSIPEASVMDAQTRLTSHGSGIELTIVEGSQPEGDRSASQSGESIRVKDGAFGWTADAQPILHDISFTAKEGQLTLLIGAVASGKTTLLKALLGEVPSSKGFVYVKNTEAAFCDQTPWLVVSFFSPKYLWLAGLCFLKLGINVNVRMLRSREISLVSLT